MHAQHLAIAELVQQRAIAADLGQCNSILELHDATGRVRAVVCVLPPDVAEVVKALCKLVSKVAHGPVEELKMEEG